MQKTGYLIINLGTPDSPAVPEVRRYLKEFLLDPYVVTLPWLLRNILVRGIILPFRPKASAHAYSQIWTEQGSPLKVNSNKQAKALAGLLDGPVALAMRYGSPSIAAAVAELRSHDITDLVVAPLYPQYAASTVATTLEEIAKHTEGLNCYVVPPFYQQPWFIEAMAFQVTKADADFDHLLMSFHGLPEQHLRTADPTGSHCLASEDCCEIQSTAHTTCYRHQAFVSARELARMLNLSHSQYSVSFQSRLGRTPWLRPYTDERLAELAQEGVKHLAVVCPAFVADNLETLEEIGLQGRETFLQAGGEEFTLIPCVNDDAGWLQGLSQWMQNAQTVSANALTSS